MQQIINEYLESILSKLQIRGSEVVFTTVPTDLSKTFNYLLHALLVAKLSARMFDKKSLISTSAFLHNREVD